MSGTCETDEVFGVDEFNQQPTFVNKKASGVFMAGALPAATNDLVVEAQYSSVDVLENEVKKEIHAVSNTVSASFGSNHCGVHPRNGFTFVCVDFFKEWDDTGVGAPYLDVKFDSKIMDAFAEAKVDYLRRRGNKDAVPGEVRMVIGRICVTRLDNRAPYSLGANLINVPEPNENGCIHKTYTSSGKKFNFIMYAGQTDDKCTEVYDSGVKEEQDWFTQFPGYSVENLDDRIIANRMVTLVPTDHPYAVIFLKSSSQDGSSPEVTPIDFPNVGPMLAMSNDLREKIKKAIESSYNEGIKQFNISDGKEGFAIRLTRTFTSVPYEVGAEVWRDDTEKLGLDGGKNKVYMKLMFEVRFI